MTCFDEEPEADPHGECRDEIHRLTALVADARCLPPGLLAAVATVLREGAAAKGCAPHESGGGQTFADHVEHAHGHVSGVRSAMQWTSSTEPDPDDLTHAIARLALAWSLR